jgi:hypothetical protein
MALNSNFRTLTADNIEGLVDNRNYLKSSFENGTIQGWTEMAVTLTSGLPTGTPTISSTAAASIALSATSTTPLSGARSLLVTGAAGWTAGQGFISDEFTLDRMDLGKPLTVTFDYERVTGTLNFSGTLGSQTLMVYIYDATAGGANWIQPAGFLGMNQSSGPGRVTATFQSSVVAGQKYRVAVIASQAVGSACSLEFDNFTCSRVTAPIGPVVTDWVSYTPTIGNLNAGTNPSQFFRWRRVGDSIQIMGNITAGGTGIFATGDVTISIPSGLSFDLTKMSVTSETVIGTGSIHDTGIGRFPCSVNLGGSNFFILVVRANAATGGNVVGNVFPSAGWYNAAGDSISFELMAPISGWSSSVQMSNDTDTRVVDLKVNNASSITPSGTIGTSFSTATNINFNTTPVKDSHSAYSSGVFTVPVSGDYFVSARAEMSHTSSTGTFVGLSIGVNNTERMAQGIKPAISNAYPFVSGLITGLNAGDQIAVRLFGDSTSKAFVTSVVNDFTVHRLSGPSVIAASEVVEATYQALAGNVMNNGTEMWLDYGTKIRDTHNAVSGAGSGNKTVSNAGWKFTAPITGRYYVNAVFHVTSGAVANSVTYGYIAVNGAAKSHSDIKAGQNPAGDAFGSQINGEVFMNAGDYLEVVGYQANGANRNQQVVNIRNQVEIVRVGAY